MLSERFSLSRPIIFDDSDNVDEIETQASETLKTKQVFHAKEKEKGLTSP